MLQRKLRQDVHGTVAQSQQTKSLTKDSADARALGKNGLVRSVTWHSSCLWHRSTDTVVALLLRRSSHLSPRTSTNWTRQWKLINVQGARDHWRDAVRPELAGHSEARCVKAAKEEK